MAGRGLWQAHRRIGAEPARWAQDAECWVLLGRWTWLAYPSLEGLSFVDLRLKAGALARSGSRIDRVSLADWRRAVGLRLALAILAVDALGWRWLARRLERPLSDRLPLRPPPILSVPESEMPT